MTTNNEGLSPNGEIDRINNEGADTARETTQLLCRAAIKVAYETVGYHLQQDKEQHAMLEAQDFPPKQASELYVLESKFNAPRLCKEFVRSYSIRLSPDTNPSGKYLRLHVPSGEASISAYEMPITEAVNEVYIEHYNGEDKHWYAMNRFGLYEYVPIILQEDDESVLDDQGIWQWIEERIPENLTTASTLFTDVVNWNTVIQKYVQHSD